MLFASSVVGTIFEVLIALIVIVVAYFKWSFQYWKRKGIYNFPAEIPFGNLPAPFRRTKALGFHLREFYHTIRANNLKYGGIYFFLSPVLYIADLDLIKNVLVKDFQYFTDRGGFTNEKDDPLSAHLFAIGGVKWRNLRTKLTPTFTSGKMRQMFQTLVDCEVSLRNEVGKYAGTGEAIDIKEILAKFTTDIIGSCAFGIECKSFENEESEFREYGRKIFQLTTIGRLKRTFGQSFPEIGKLLKLSVFSKDLTNFFINLVKGTIDYRHRENVKRNDFIQLLMELNENKLDKDHDGKSLTVEEMAAQAFVFFVAGFETSSTTMTFALYELAKNQEVQQKVRDEINTVLARHDGKITYDAINEMKYMHQVVEETLRMYPPVSFITRVAVKDYKVPDEDLIIEKDTKVIIPIFGLHTDPEYYPDPETFDPERFTPENKQERNQFTHIPFGEGPRICIGMRFGLMQSKVGLTSILKNYKVTVNKKTKEPLVMSPKQFIFTTEGEMWLSAEKV